MKWIIRVELGCYAAIDGSRVDLENALSFDTVQEAKEFGEKNYPYFEIKQKDEH